MVKLSVLNPVAESMQTRVTLPPRLGTLNGKRIGLYWNMKAGGDVALRATEQMLKERYPDAQFTYYHGDVGQILRHVTSGMAARMAREVDAVVGTTAD